MESAPKSVRLTIRTAALLVALAAVVGGAVGLEHAQYGGTQEGYVDSSRDAEVLLSIPSYRDWGAAFSQALRDSLSHPADGPSRTATVARWMMVVDFAYLLYFLVIGLRAGANRLGLRVVYAGALALICSIPTAMPVPPHAAAATNVFLMPWYHSGLSVHLLSVVRALVGLHIVQEFAESGVMVVVVATVWSVTMITMAMRLCYTQAIVFAFCLAFFVHWLVPDSRRPHHKRLATSSGGSNSIGYTRMSSAPTQGSEHPNPGASALASRQPPPAPPAAQGAVAAAAIASAASGSAATAGAGLGERHAMVEMEDM